MGALLSQIPKTMAIGELDISDRNGVGNKGKDHVGVGNGGGENQSNKGSSSGSGNVGESRDFRHDHGLGNSL